MRSACLLLAGKRCCRTAGRQERFRCGAFRCSQFLHFSRGFRKQLIGTRKGFARFRIGKRGLRVCKSDVCKRITAFGFAHKLLGNRACLRG